MADQYPTPAQAHRMTAPPSLSAVFLRKLQERAPNTTQLAGILALLVTASFLLLITGLTITGAVLGLIFFLPLIIVSSPVWIPAGTLLFIVTAGFFFVCGFGIAFLASLSWMYRYFRGLHPPGSDRVDTLGAGFTTPPATSKTTPENTVAICKVRLRMRHPAHDDPPD